MSKLEDQTGHPPGHNPSSAIGFRVAGVLPAALGLTVFIVIIVPVVLAAGVAAAIIRLLKFRKVDHAGKPHVIEGEYAVLNPGSGKSGRLPIRRKQRAGAQIP